MSPRSSTEPLWLNSIRRRADGQSEPCGARLPFCWSCSRCPPPRAQRRCSRSAPSLTRSSSPPSRRTPIAFWSSSRPARIQLVRSRCRQDLSRPDASHQLGQRRRRARAVVGRAGAGLLRRHIASTSSTPAADGDLTVDEFTAAGDAADIATRRPLLRIEHSTYGNHNGGQLAFGPDGYLYIGTGDGGSGGDPFQSGQTTSSLLGKVLRIDPTPGATPYAIPAGNPFADGRLGAPEVWSYGLRNPWRFSFDRSTGALLIGDVGQGSREEIDYAAQPAAGAGLNFGWNCREGGIAYSAPGALCTGASGFTDPIFDYGHSGGNCSITGGYVVRDTSLGDLYGRYLYADVCVGQVRSLIPGPTASGDRSEGLTVSSPSSFGEDSCGRVYVTSLGNDVVSRFTGATPIDCSNVPPPPGTQPPPPGTDPPTDDPAPPRCGGEPATRVAGTGSDDPGFTRRRRDRRRRARQPGQGRRGRRRRSAAWRATTSCAAAQAPTPSAAATATTDASRAPATERGRADRRDTSEPPLRWLRRHSAARRRRIPPTVSLGACSIWRSVTRWTLRPLSSKSAVFRRSRSNAHGDECVT